MVLMVLCTQQFVSFDTMLAQPIYYIVDDHVAVCSQGLVLNNQYQSRMLC